MTKIYDIVQAEDNLYVIDSEQKPEEFEVHVCTKYKPCSLHSHHWRNNEDSCLKIIATTDTSFELPLLKLPAVRNIKNPYAEICDRLGNPIDAIDTHLQFIKDKDDSWKTCNKLIEQIKTIFHEFRNTPFNKEYPEEEIGKAFIAGANWERNMPNEVDIATYLKSHIQSIVSIPKQVELEIEQTHTIGFTEEPEGRGWMLIKSEKDCDFYERPVVENKFVKVINVIYE